MNTNYNDINDIEKIHRKYLSDPSDENLSQLVEACQGLIYHYAKLYGGGYCFEDICQSAYEGLLKAIQNFDPSKAVKFVTYASHMIIGEIRHFVRRERKYYYPPYLKTYQKKVDDIIASNLEDENTIVSHEDLAEMLNLHPESIPSVMGAGLVHLGHLELSSIIRQRKWKASPSPWRINSY